MRHGGRGPTSSPLKLPRVAGGQRAGGGGRCHAAPAQQSPEAECSPPLHWEQVLAQLRLGPAPVVYSLPPAPLAPALLCSWPKEICCPWALNPIPKPTVPCFGLRV